jgi:hypothetical protein
MWRSVRCENSPRSIPSCCPSSLRARDWLGGSATGSGRGRCRACRIGRGIHGGRDAGTIAGCGERGGERHKAALVTHVRFKVDAGSADRAHLHSEEIAALYQRGEQLIAQGDIAAARLMFARAAEVGDARSALALGASYDPDVLKKLGVIGVAANAETARDWVRESVRVWLMRDGAAHRTAGATAMNRSIARDRHQPRGPKKCWR